MSKTVPMLDDPSRTSSDYETMRQEWDLVSDIMAGVTAMRRKGQRYLPRYENESTAEYGRRLETAPWRPEFTDILRSITSKPFGKEVMIKGQAPDRIVGQLDPATNMRVGGLVDDIDGQGNNLTVFAREAFSNAIAKGFHAIMVDYPTMPPNATVADEKAIGARPYWLHIPADSILALYTEVVGGREVITHVRIRDYAVQQDGFSETTVERIRVLEPGRWEVWEKQPSGTWLQIDEGELRRGGKTKTDIPMVLFFTGERLGTTSVRPPLSDLARMQVELYQALSRQDEVLTYAGSPMLAANGLAAPTGGEKISIGPKTVLFAPPAPDGGKTSWEFIQPQAANIREIREHVAAIQSDMRRIGMQPLTEQPGNPSATGQSIAAAKAHSAVKAWALGLNDALEQAFKFTTEWLGVSDVVQTEVSTDFSVLPYAQFPLQALATARQGGDISRKAYLESLKRFDVLPQDFDDEADGLLLKSESAKGGRRKSERSPLLG